MLTYMRESRFYLFHLTFCTVVMRYFCIPWNPNMNQNRLVVFLNCISFLMYLRNSINEEQIKPFYQLCLYSIILGWGLKLLSDSGFHSSLSHSNFFHNLVHILLEKGWTPLKLPLLPISLLLPILIFFFRKSHSTDCNFKDEWIQLHEMIWINQKLPKLEVWDV